MSTLLRLRVLNCHVQGADRFARCQPQKPRTQRFSRMRIAFGPGSRPAGARPSRRRAADWRGATDPIISSRHAAPTGKKVLGRGPKFGPRQRVTCYDFRMKTWKIWSAPRAAALVRALTQRAQKKPQRAGRRAGRPAPRAAGGSLALPEGSPHSAKPLGAWFLRLATREPAEPVRAVRV